MKDIKLLNALFIFLLASTLSAKEYYVSKSGSNSNPGTKEEPFLTIQKAAIVTSDGDVCIIGEGTYYEQVKPYHNGSTFKAAPGANVVVSMYEEKNNWTEYKDGIYVTTIGKNLNDENQVIYDGKIMNLARWPNKSNFNPFDLEAYKAWGTNSSLSYSSIPDWAWEDGGVLFFLGKNRWTSWRVPITGASSGNVTFNELSTNWDYAGSHSPTNGGEFFLSNILEALDAPGEWYIDRSNMKLYFKPPEGAAPETGKTFVRRYNQAINLSGMRNITVEGITFYGGKINLKNAYQCLVQNCQVLYGNHTIASSSSATVSQASIELDNSSRENKIQFNNIQWGAGNGIILKGTNNRVENNYIGNFDYLGCYAAPVELRGQNQLIRNEIFNGGRDDIRGGGNGAEVGYNDVHHSNMINDDCGGIYFCCGTFGYTRIHHNWFHDINSRNENFDKYKGCGVYLDNTTRQVIVDHNVMWNLEWTGIQINWAGANLHIYNNTIWCKSTSNSKPMGRWVNGYEFTDVPVYNTLTNKSELHYTDLKNTCEFSLNDSPFENYSERDFRPKEGTCPVDGGMEIPGYTEGFKGSAPDVGAYESGQEAWVAGPSWEIASVSVDSVSILDASEVGFTLPQLSYKTYYEASKTGTLTLQLLNGSDEVMADAHSQVFKSIGTTTLKLEFNPVLPTGIYKLKLTMTPDGGAQSAECVKIIELKEPVVANEIQFLDTDDRIVLFETRLLKTEVLPLDAIEKDLTWASSNTDIIKINPLSGEMTAILVGEATITAKTANGVEASFLLKVVPKTGEAIPWIEDFTLANDASMDMGQTSWTIETSNEGAGSLAAINSNQLAIRNLECIFRSGIIDIYGIKSVKLEMDVTGDFRARDNEKDSLLIYYVVDNVEYLAGSFSDRFKKTTVSIEDIRGDALQILIKAKTAYSTEIYYIDDIRITENADASIQSADLMKSISVYPNPSNGDEITIKCNLNSSSLLTLKDLQGRTVYQTLLTNNETILHDLGISRGMYIMCFHHQGKNLSKSLIIR